MYLKTAFFFIILVNAAFGCNGDVEYVRPNRDPEVASAIKLDNLKKFGGNWIFTETNRNFYLEISETGFYWTMSDKDSVPMGGDYGEIFHDKPGRMIFISDRQDCQSKVETPRSIALLSPMENGIKLSSSTQNEKFFALIPVERKPHVDALPCSETAGTEI